MIKGSGYIIAITGLFIASPLLAQETGFYVGLSGGLATQADLSFMGEAGPGNIFDCNCTNPPTTGRDRLTGAFDVDSAAIFGGAVGYDFGLIRIDAELSYSRAKLGKFSVGPGAAAGQPLTPAQAATRLCDSIGESCPNGENFANGAKITRFSAMGNAWLDLPVGEMLVPYAGGGIGMVHTKVDSDVAKKARFAWQVGAGVELALSPRLGLTLDVRHRRSSRLEWRDLGAASSGEFGQSKLTSVSAGARVSF